MKITNKIIRTTHKLMGTDSSNEYARIRLLEKYDNIASEYMQNLAETSDRFKDFLAEIKELLIVSDVKDGKLIRVGSKGDGGYVMLNSFDGNVAYSFGIADDVSWDAHISELTGKDVYQYDHTIQGLPYCSPKFHWFKLGITGENETEELKTLKTLIEKNGHVDRNNMILKMDVEGAEWSCFSNATEETLNQFDQIVLELHGMYNYNNKEIMMSALTNLNKTHQLIHVHGNNACPAIMLDGWNLPALLECTYVKRANRTFVDNDTFYPTGLDHCNVESIRDIPLGFWGGKR